MIYPSMAGCTVLGRCIFTIGVVAAATSQLIGKSSDTPTIHAQLPYLAAISEGVVSDTVRMSQQDGVS